MTRQTTMDELQQEIAKALRDWDRPKRGEGWRLWSDDETVIGRFTTQEVARTVAKRLRETGLA